MSNRQCVEKAAVTCAEVGPTSGRQESTEGTNRVGVRRELRAAQLLGEGGEGEVRPGRLPVRRMKQQQEWGDPSRTPSLGGAKLRLSLAQVMGSVGGINSELQQILYRPRGPLKLGQGQDKSLGKARGFRGKTAGPPWTNTRAQEPMGI